MDTQNKKWFLEKEAYCSLESHQLPIRLGEVFAAMIDKITWSFIFDVAHNINFILVIPTLIIDSFNLDNFVLSSTPIMIVKDDEFHNIIHTFFIIQFNVFLVPCERDSF